MSKVAPAAGHAVEETKAPTPRKKEGAADASKKAEPSMQQKAKERREEAKGAAMNALLNAYDDKTAFADSNPTPLPRRKKQAFYKCRKCLGLAEVSIEVAIIEGYPSLVRATLARLAKHRPHEINQYYADGTTPLIVALKEKREDVVDVMINCPLVKYNLKDTKTGLWPLHLAVVYGLHHVLRRMLDKPIPDVVDVEVRDARGLTPLLLAGLVGDHESFMQLVKAGASPKAVDNEGMTLLHCVAYGGHVASVTWALGEGNQDREVLDKRKLTAYDWAMLQNKGVAAATIADFKGPLDDYHPTPHKPKDKKKH